jgi:hypothetical protein
MKTTRSLSYLVLVLLLLATSSLLAADKGAASLTADEILSRWQSAIGKDINDQGGSHVTAELATSGLTGTYEEWIAPDNRYRFRVALGNGLFVQDVIMIADSAWQRDKTGKVSRLEGVDLQRTLSGRFFSQNGQFEANHGGAKIEVVPGDSGRFVGLAITPPGGMLSTYYLDTLTWLPNHSTSPADDRISTSWYEDWQRMNGQMVARKMRQRTGADGRYDVETKVLSVETGLTFADDIFAVEVVATKDFHFASGDRSVSIPIELNGSHIFVPVTINGKAKKWFILDSGAEMGVINKPVAEELEIPMSGALEGRGAGEQSVSVSLASNLTLDIPGVTVSNQTLVVISFEGLEEKMGRPMDGILGSEIFHRFVVQIDYEHKLMHLYDPATFAYEGNEQPTSIILESNLPMIDVTFQIAGCKMVKGKFLMDTGAGSALDISSPTVEAQGLMRCVSRTYDGSSSYGVGGASKQLVARLDSLGIGGYVVPKLIGALVQDKTGAGGTRDRDGLIGGELFKHFTMTIDYTNRRVWFKPNGNFGEIPQHDMSGLKLTALGEQFEKITVDIVLPGSVAEKAGMKPGDEIISVAGKSVDGMNLEEIKAFLRVANPALTIEYLRGKKTKSVTVALKPLI